MFQGLRRYDEYTAAGTWLGEVPAHWRWDPARTLFRERKETGFIDEQLLSVTIGRGVIPQSELLSSTSNKDSSNLDKSKYKVVKPGDLVYNKMRAWQGAAGLSSCRGIVSPAYIVMTPRDGVPAYFHHLVRTPTFAKEAERWSYGITSDQWSLRPEHFKMIRFPVPPVDEQAAIVKYLAHANARIDNAIAAKRRLISLLDEFLVARMDELARVDSTASELVSVGQTSVLVQTGPFGSQLHADEYVEGGVPVINPSHLSASGIVPDPSVAVGGAKAYELKRHRLQVSDVIAARRGDVGRCAVVTEREVGWLCGTGSLLIRLRADKWVPEYFQMLFSSRRTRDVLELGSVGSTMTNLNAAQVSRMRLARPDLGLQAERVREASQLRSAHVRRISAIQREIDLLREFRTRLVADVATGQVDVRDIAKSLPEPEVDAPALDRFVDLGDVPADHVLEMSEV